MNIDFTNINELPLIDEYNRHFRSMTYQKLILTDQWNRWLQRLVEDDEWNLFTCTVTFKPIDLNNSKERWESDYKTLFLQKIKKRLERNPDNFPNCIPFEDFYYFERYEKSKRKQNGKKTPFHIHSLLPIKTCHMNRFWSFDESSLHHRLQKDLLSIDVVQDVLIEQVRDSNSISWIRYITKLKDL